MRGGGVSALFVLLFPTQKLWQCLGKKAPRVMHHGENSTGIVPQGFIEYVKYLQQFPFRFRLRQHRAIHTQIILYDAGYYSDS